MFICLVLKLLNDPSISIAFLRLLAIFLNTASTSIAKGLACNNAVSVIHCE